MVHQHFMLVPVFTVAENVTLGDEETRALGLLDRRRMRRKVRDLSERYGLRVDPDALTGDLPVGVQQRVEILKALVRDAQRADPGRAHGRADPRRDRGPVPDHAGAAGKRAGHRLHLAQAQGGAGDRRHDHGPAPRPRGRRAAAGHQRGRAGRADGRPLRSAAGRQDDRQARPGRAGSPGPGRAQRDQRGRGRGARSARRRQRAVLPGAGGRDPGRGRRAGQRPDRAVRGADGAAARHVRVGSPGRPRHHRRVAGRPAAGRHRVHPRGPAAGRARRPLPGIRRTLSWTPTTGRRSRPGRPSTWT